MKMSLECPVCLEIPRPGAGPIYGCRNGHLLCQDCAQKIEKCPTCREKDIRCRNLFAEFYIDTEFKNVPFKCKFHGCEVKLSMANGRLTKHEKFCPYQEVFSAEDFSTRWFYLLFLYFLICTLNCMLRCR